MIMGFPGNLGDLAVSIEMPVENPAYQLQIDPRPTSRGRRGRTRDETMVSPSEGNEVRRNERQGWHGPIVVLKRGNGQSRTPWSEGGAALWTGRWNHAEDIVPHQRVAAKPPSGVRTSDSTT